MIRRVVEGFHFLGQLTELEKRSRRTSRGTAALKWMLSGKPQRAVPTRERRGSIPVSSGSSIPVRNRIGGAGAAESITIVWNDSLPHFPLSR
jgi:hypothetical protein